MSLLAPPTDPNAHVVTKLISPGAWALIEDKFSAFGKETLAKVVYFVIVSCSSCSSDEQARARPIVDVHASMRRESALRPVAWRV